MQFIFINQLRSTIQVGLACAAICLLFLFTPALTDFFFGPLSREAEAKITLGAMVANLSLTLSMAGFGLTRFLGLARMSNLKYLILGIYFLPLLIDASLMTFIWIAASHQIQETQARGLKVR